MPIPSSPARGKLRACALLLTLPLVSSCVSYDTAPIDSLAVLEELEGVRFSAPKGSSEVESPGPSEALGPRELSAFAITHNPDLRAARSEVQVSRALLVEAGLLPDPNFAWSAMDVLAAKAVGDSVADRDYWSGLGIMFPLPRPGELSARKGAARWRIEEARTRVLLAEWALARGVHLAFEDLTAVRRLLKQSGELLEVVEHTADYFARAREAHVATAIESKLAEGDVLQLRREQLRLSFRERRARHALNALLGLPPETLLTLDLDNDPGADLAELPALEDLDRQALSRRPDLAGRLAAYQVAEQELRLQVALQWPLVALGTGISFQVGLFSRFNKPAIQTARRRRTQLAEEYRAAVHEARRELHDAYATWSETGRELRFIEDQLIPNAEASLDLANLAFTEGVATLVQILVVQRALISVRTSYLEARARYGRAGWALLASSGAILADSTDDPAGSSAQQD